MPLAKDPPLRTTNDNGFIRPPLTDAGMEERERAFQALGSAVRLTILMHLAAGSLTAGEIAQLFNMTKSSLSRHLSVLEGAGLIESRREGQFIHYSAIEGRAAAIFTATLDLLDEAPPARKLVPPAGEARREHNSATHLPPVVAWLRNSGN
jgi:DNA-binding transcriptional ArsR family regulator